MKKQIITASISLLSFQSHSQVGIGTTSPNPSSILEVSSSDKGLLIPRVDLDDVSTSTPITNPATGLLIYNDGGDEIDGFYYWNGSEWTPFTSGNSSALFSAENGLTQVGTKVELGGTLAKNTTITNSGNNLDISGTGELQISDTENPVFRIHSSANETNKGGRIEFNENDNRYGYSLRHQTGSGLVNSIQRGDGLWFEMKKNNVYTPAFGFSDNGGNSIPRVGVLTTNPRSSFHTDGTGLFSSGSSSTSIGGTSYLSANNQLSLENSNNGSVVQYFNSIGTTPKAVKLGLNPTYGTNGVFSIQTANNGNSFSDRIVIEMDGDVGIGTLDPTSKLHVQGDARITGNITSEGNIVGGKNLNIQDTAFVDKINILNPTTLATGVVSGNLVYNTSSKMVELESGSEITSFGSQSTITMNDDYNAAYKLYVHKGNACGQTMINEYLISGSNANNTWVIKPVKGVCPNGNTAFSETNNKTIDVINSRPGCQDGTSSGDWDYTISISGSGVISISNSATTTYSMKVHKIF